MYIRTEIHGEIPSRKLGSNHKQIDHFLFLFGLSYLKLSCASRSAYTIHGKPRPHTAVCNPLQKHGPSSPREGNLEVHNILDSQPSAAHTAQCCIDRKETHAIG